MNNCEWITVYSTYVAKNIQIGNLHCTVCTVCANNLVTPCEGDVETLKEGP